MAVKWNAPADDGGSPITAYRVVILEGSTEIKNVNITDSDTTSWNAGGLKRDTEYTVKVLPRNAVFEGPPVENKVKTKYEGNKMRYPVLVIFCTGLSIGVESSLKDVHYQKLKATIR